MENVTHKDRALIVLLSLVATLCVLIGASLTAAIYSTMNTRDVREDVRMWKNDVQTSMDLYNIYVQEQTALLKAHDLPTPDVEALREQLEEEQ